MTATLIRTERKKVSERGIIPIRRRPTMRVKPIIWIHHLQLERRMKKEWMNLVKINHGITGTMGMKNGMPGTTKGQIAETGECPK